MFMKLSSIPVVKLPLVDVSTDPLDLLVAGLALRMKQLARTSPKFIELVHDRAFRIQIGTDLGVARQIIINHGHIDTVAGSPEKADFILQFADSEQGVKTLLKGDPTAFMTGMQDGSIKMEGDFSLLVWFNQAAKLIPPKLPKPVKDKVRQARAFIKEKLVVTSNKNSRSGVFLYLCFNFQIESDWSIINQMNFHIRSKNTCLNIFKL